jgi:hypothetical protein
MDGFLTNNIRDGIAVVGLALALSQCGVALAGAAISRLSKRKGGGLDNLASKSRLTKSDDADLVGFSLKWFFVAAFVTIAGSAFFPLPDPVNISIFRWFIIVICCIAAFLGAFVQAFLFIFLCVFAGEFLIRRFSSLYERLAGPLFNFSVTALGLPVLLVAVQALKWIEGTESGWLFWLTYCYAIAFGTMALLVLLGGLVAGVSDLAGTVRARQ